MTRRSLAITFVLLAFSLPLLAQSGVTLPQYREVKLPNGTLLLLMEKRDVPLIAINATTPATTAPRIRASLPKAAGI